MTSEEQRRQSEQNQPSPDFAGADNQAPAQVTEASSTHQTSAASETAAHPGGTAESRDASVPFASNQTAAAAPARYAAPPRSTTQFSQADTQAQETPADGAQTTVPLQPAAPPQQTRPLQPGQPWGRNVAGNAPQNAVPNVNDPVSELGAGAGGGFGNGGGDLGQGTSAAYGDVQPDPAEHQSKAKGGSIAKVVGIAALVSALVGGGAGAAIGWQVAGSNGTSTSASSSSSNVTINNPQSVTEITAAAAKASPSVVTISATSGNESGTGSGVVLDNDGHIVTNNHVVTLDGATSNATLSVTLSDGNIYDASVVGLDSTTDLAVIQVKNPPALTPITMADSSKLNVGDTAVAIGAPQGLQNTVTSGIVSALNRAISLSSSAAQEDDGSADQGNDGYDYWNYFGNGQSQQPRSQSNSSSTDSSIYLSVIQTDAAINPGNSGGPLVNSAGELIGVNVAIATASSSTGQSSSSGSIGIGFAIPSSVVQRVTDELIQNGKAEHGQIGATVSSATAQDGATGALIKDVTSGGPADQAGLRGGDIITKVDDVRITSSSHLIGTVRQSGPGTKITVEYVRNGQTQTTEVTLEAAAQ